MLGLDYERSVTAIEPALSHNPYCVTALMWGAFVYAMGGESDKAAAFAERALRISPFDPLTWHAHLCLGHARLTQDRDEEALAHYARALNLNPQYQPLHYMHALGLALTGRIDEAREAARKGVELAPHVRFGPLMEIVRGPGLKEKLTRGMRLAGVPE